MSKNLKHLTIVFFILFISAGFTFAAISKTDHSTDAHDKYNKVRIGSLIHESVVDGYMLAYYLLDLRDEKADGLEKATMDRTSALTNKEIEKPHHFMVYIMDKDHKPIIKGKVGFLIKDSEGVTQKNMGMYMSLGFGTTADMKNKGVYTISTKALLDGKKLIDSFKYEIK